jgi:tetratricopeptide (TPR) repeat protein
MSNVLDWSTVGRVQRDIAAHDRLSQVELESLHEKVDRAQGLHRANSIGSAQRLYEEVLVSDPLDWDCLSNLAKISFAAGNYEKAKELFERAVALRPERDKTVFYLGHAFFKMHILDRAEATFREVCESYGKRSVEESGCDKGIYHEAMAMLGLILQQGGRHADAQQMYEKVLKEDREHVQTLCHMCALKSSMGKAEEASKDHAKVVLLDKMHTKRVCPYLDSLFPSDSEMLHKMENLEVQISQAAHGKVPSKSLYRTVTRKLARALKSFKSHH